MATLAGGNHYIPSLYYSTASEVGYTVIAVPGEDGSVAPVLTVSEARSWLSGAGYDAILAGRLGPVTLNVNDTAAGGTGDLQAHWGVGGGHIDLLADSNATIVAGDGTGSAADQRAGATLDILLGSGNDTVNALFGSSIITTGTGSTLIYIDQGSALINLNGLGADTIDAGVGAATVSVLGDVADHVLIDENLSQLSFTNGAASSSILGGGGATTINAGGTGAVLYTAEAYDLFQTAGSLSGLTDSVTDHSASADTLIAGAGTTMIDAAGSGASVTMMSGSGDATLTGSGSQADIFEVSALTAGSHAITIGNWTTSDTLALQGFGGSALAASQILISGGNAVVTLSDGTLVTFTGVTNPADIIQHTTST